MDFGASVNSDNTVFFDGASVWYKHSDALRIDLGQRKFLLEWKRPLLPQNLKQLNAPVNRQFAEQLKLNARHTADYLLRGNYLTSSLMILLL